MQNSKLPATRKHLPSATKDQRASSAEVQLAAFGSDTGAAIAAAAGRFLALPQIAETIFTGTNGFHARLPGGTEAQLDLWHQWPDADRCRALASGLERAMAEPCDAEQASVAVRVLIASFPSGERHAANYSEALRFHLAEQAVEKGWSSAAVNRGLEKLVQESRFVPAVAEVLAAVAEAHREMRFAAWAAGKAVELSFDLKWNLIEAGIIEDEDHGEDF